MRVLRGPPASEGGGSRSSGADVRGRAGRGGGSSGVEGWGGVARLGREGARAVALSRVVSVLSSVVMIV